MRSKTIEIRWHDLNAIYSSDFQPFPPQQFKRFISANSSQANGKQKEKEHVIAGGRSYKLATGGADNHVRLWLIHPNIPDPSLVASNSTLQHTSGSTTLPPPRAEFLATLQRHSAAVNVVRWSPKEEVLASAGDDGVVLLWVPKTNAGNETAPAVFGEAPGSEVGQKEFWRRKLEIRVTSKEIYDLAWSPDGSHFIVGCTDNSAKIYDATTGSCIKVIAEHSHYVQGVAWDPLNEFIATQSSDRTVHIHRIQQTKNGLEFHPYSRTQKMEIHHSRTPSFSSTCSPSIRPTFPRRESTTMSDTEGSEHGGAELSTLASSSILGPPTPSSQPGTPLPNASMKPPSRRGSFSSSVAASPPSSHSTVDRVNSGMARFGRSPSPLPAVRPGSLPSVPTARQGTSNALFGDESYTHYFRRLSFSPDGALLLTPAGQIQSQLLSFSSSSPQSINEPTPTPSSSSKAKRPSVSDTAPKPTVYIYSRANLSNSPIAHLPGQKTASIAVKFSPVFYDLNTFSTGKGEPQTTVVDEHDDKEVVVKLGNVDNVSVIKDSADESIEVAPTTSGPSSIVPPSASETPSSSLSAPSSNLGGGPSTSVPASPQPAVFSLPYRMYFAVATQDAVLLYDTQQTSPLAIFKGLHYSGFTDLAWSPDGQSLILSSLDGYCSVVVFDPGELGTLHPTQQHQKQLQALAATLSTSTSSHSVPSSPALGHTAPTPALVAPPILANDDEDLLVMEAEHGSSGGVKRSAEVDRPAAVSYSALGLAESSTVEVDQPGLNQGAVKKKRRIEPTLVGSLD